ncbi:hypothetical protein [Kordiimonas sp.]|uniref:hypothetical protein n=1 Tax=Kordiimonas sp. TaxID=1970157 RepID=UPI003A92B3DE
MNTRLTESMVTFRHPFVVYGYKKSLPAGTYKVAFDEEILPNIFFPAFRRTQATLHLHAEAARPGVMEYLTITPQELDAALKRDEATTRKTAQKQPEDKTTELDREAIERGEDEGMMYVSDVLPQRHGNCPPEPPSSLRPWHNR